VRIPSSATWRVVGPGLGDDPPGRAVDGIAFAVDGVLAVDDAVVVQRGPPEHGAVGHHALLDRLDLLVVTRVAGDARGAEVAGVDEANVVLVLAQARGAGDLRGWRWSSTGGATKV
jgi:hypothetical protein